MLPDQDTLLDAIVSALCLKNKNNYKISLKTCRSWILQAIWFLGFLLYYYCLNNKPAPLSILKSLGKTPTYYHMMNYLFSLYCQSLWYYSTLFSVYLKTWVPDNLWNCIFSSQEFPTLDATQSKEQEQDWRAAFMYKRKRIHCTVCSF